MNISNIPSPQVKPFDLYPNHNNPIDLPNPINLTSLTDLTNSTDPTNLTDLANLTDSTDLTNLINIMGSTDSTDSTNLTNLTSTDRNNRGKQKLTKQFKAKINPSTLNKPTMTEYISVRDNNNDIILSNPSVIDQIIERTSQKLAEMIFKSEEIIDSKDIIKNGLF